MWAFVLLGLQTYVFSTSCNGARSAISRELGSPACIARGDGGGLGFLRTYLTSLRPGKQIPNRDFSLPFNSVLLNPRLRRLFCNEAPKRRSKLSYAQSNIVSLKLIITACGNASLDYYAFLLSLMNFQLLIPLKFGVLEYENYYPKNKKDTPERNNQKAEAKGTRIVLNNGNKQRSLLFRLIIPETFGFHFFYIK